MSLITKHYMGEIGTNFYIDCGYDVSSATDISVLLERPDGTIVTKTAVPATYQSSTNYVLFTTIVSDFDQVGEYRGQVQLTLGSWTGRGTTFFFTVYNNYDDPVVG